MCGLFGYAGAGADVESLAVVAQAAATRGPNAWGMAWGTDDPLDVYRTGTALTQSPHALNRAAGARQLIGQCRLATSGPVAILANNQPLVRGGWAVVHNGNVYNCDQIFQQWGYTPLTANDSEALLAWLVSDGGLPLPRFTRAVEAVDRRSPLAALCLYHDTLLAARRGHPLYAWFHADGTYLCSRQVTPDAKLLPDNRVVRFHRGMIWEHSGLASST